MGLLRGLLVSLWDHFWHMKITFGAFRDHLEVTLSISTSNFMCDACVLHTCTGLVGPKRGKVKKPLVFKTFKGVKGATRNLKPAATERAGPVGRGKGEGKPPPCGLV